MKKIIVLSSLIFASILHASNPAPEGQIDISGFDKPQLFLALYEKARKNRNKIKQRTIYNFSELNYDYARSWINEAKKDGERAYKMGPNAFEYDLALEVVGSSMSAEWLDSQLGKGATLGVITALEKNPLSKKCPPEEAEKIERERQEEQRRSEGIRLSFLRYLQNQKI